MTKKEMFATIKTLLTDNDEIVAFCDHEMELLSRPKVKKPTKNQVENEGIIARISDILGGTDKGMTISEIASALGGEYANQRVSALVKKLKDNGTVTRTEVKGKAYFTLAE